MEALIFFIVIYTIFGIIVYSKCRFLLRMLGVVSALFIGAIIFHFILTYISSITCRYDERGWRTVEVSKANCTGGDLTEKKSSIECRQLVNKYEEFLIGKINCSEIN